MSLSFLDKYPEVGGREGKSLLNSGCKLRFFFN